MAYATSMERKSKKKPISQEEQSRRFLEAAREAGVDESEGTLKKLVRKIAPKKPNRDKKVRNK